MDEGSELKSFFSIHRASPILTSDLWGFFGVRNVTRDTLKVVFRKGVAMFAGEWDT